MPGQNNNRRLTIQASVSLVAIVAKETSFERNRTKLPTLPLIALASPTVIDVNLEGFAVGDYTFYLAYENGPHKVADPIPVNIKITR